MSNTAVQKCGFCEEKIFRKKQKKVSCQICNTWFHKKCSQLSGKDFKLISFDKLNSLCRSYFCKHVSFSHVHGSPKNNENLKRYSPMNIIITPRSNKTNFYNNFNSIELSFDDNGHHTFINSKYYDINELNAPNNKKISLGLHSLFK